MKIIELEICNVRGIRNLTLKPGGKNMVIWGPNGTGKSAVIDALDFLFTGRISRLTGTGTGNLSLSKHGPHIDCDAKDAVVAATIQIKSHQSPIEIRRSMAKPNRLECPTALRPRLATIEDLAKRGQHVLTRREILSYITAEPSNRAQQIQALLDISAVENIRKVMVKLVNDTEKALKTAQRHQEQGKSAVNATTQKASFDLPTVTEFVNQNRQLLGALPIAELSAAALRSGVIAPVVVASKDRPNMTVLQTDLQNLRNVIDAGAQADITEIDTELRSLLQALLADPTRLALVERTRLYMVGRDLIDESGNCPLCGTAWEPGTLAEHIQRHLDQAEEIARTQKRIDRLATTVTERANRTVAYLGKVIAAARLSDQLGVQATALQSWATRLQVLVRATNEPLNRYLSLTATPTELTRLHAPLELDRVLTEIQQELAAQYPAATPEQTAWDTLVRLKENLKSLEASRSETTAAATNHNRASQLLNGFQAARDSVLGTLYTTIEDRFVDLYRQIHGADEDDFNAALHPDGPGLNLEVDFYGRGAHPPHALHSEGHQDSMGLCLYLALAEYLNKDVIDVILLDDVVMSVDAGHRRELCHMFSTAFSQKQFIITTHDRTWANQLKTTGIATSKGVVEFINWNVTTGPQVNSEVDMW